MGISGGPQIIRDSSLVLALEASDANSNNRYQGRNWTDLSGNDNSGSIINGPSLNSDVYGSFNFNGINSYITIKNNTSSSFTLGCWIKTTVASLTGGAAYSGNGILWSDVGGPGNDFILAIVNNTAVWATGDTETQVVGSTILNTGQWFHIMAVKDGTTNSKQLYVNTVLEGTATSSTASLTANPNIVIGGNTLDKRFFSGSISTVQIYNRALSATEIQFNYNQYKTRFNRTTPNIVTYTSLNTTTAIESFNDVLEFSNVLVGYPSFDSANAVALVNETP
jgi:hypothetical protein